MKVLLVNKFLYPNGGSETYLFKLGAHLQSLGHEVQYFGMDDEKRTVGNNVNSYTGNMDFHNASVINKLTYSLKTVYSNEARKKIRLVLEDFKPDVCHLNNFNYQLTPSIILEIVKWRKKTGRKCRIVYTAHDLQLVCPNHLMMNPLTKKPCEKCLGGHYINCIKGKCVHGSTAKSAIGAAEAWIWNKYKVYKNIDAVIAPSFFLADKLSNNDNLKNQIKVLHNFVDTNECKDSVKKNFILYFGRYSAEKGIDTLLKAVDELPDYQFVFAGSGPLEGEINKRKNIENKGFLNGEKLAELISQARFTVIPSECFENCPFAVMESQMYGTPVLGADIGGIPELIDVEKTGELFESGNAVQLKERIENLMIDNDKVERYSKNCKTVSFASVDAYCKEIMKLYQ
ncbi:MAG: glycosyltransferase [Clostridia bacterium]|nr:glycosyltransferase [Clostridia bacterium]